MSEFKVGDVVEWTSQSAGFTRTKVGQVVQIVPPGGDPEGVRNPGMSRDHTSFVVACGSRRYWPRTSHLRRPDAKHLPSLPEGVALLCRVCGDFYDTWEAMFAHRDGDGTCARFRASLRASPEDEGVGK